MSFFVSELYTISVMLRLGLYAGRLNVSSISMPDWEDGIACANFTISPNVRFFPCAAKSLFIFSRMS